MTPPEATQAGQSSQTGATPPAVSLHPLLILQQRSDFLRANSGRRQHAPAFALQARNRHQGETSPESIRVGFTCSKKVGNAVARNRAKRRLREIARAVLPLEGKPGWDYVMIGRRETTANQPFDEMLQSLRTALGRIHSPKGERK